MALARRPAARCRSCSFQPDRDAGALALLNALNESALVTLNVPSNRIGESVKSEMAEISDDEGLFFQGDNRRRTLSRNVKTIFIHVKPKSLEDALGPEQVIFRASPNT